MFTSPSTTLSSDPLEPGSLAPARSCVAETAGLMRFDPVDEDPALRARRLAERFGVDILQEVELLQLHLARSGCVDAGDLAARLIDRFGGLVAGDAALSCDRRARTGRGGGKG